MNHPFCGIFQLLSAKSFLHLLAVGLLLVNGALQAEACEHWGEGVVTGSLDSTRLAEASGVAASLIYPNRLYHVNDSGYDPEIFVTNLHGGDIRSIGVKGFNAGWADIEDISMGPCQGQKQCLFIGDIGDNAESRWSVKVLVVEEQSIFPESIDPLLRLKLTYPDGPHNAEGLAVHPNGDIYILTKALSAPWSTGFLEGLMERWFGHKKERSPVPARLYKLERRQWESSGKGKHELSFVGEIDIPTLTEDTSSWDLAKLATGLSIAPDGRRFLVMTYSFIMEFNIDLSVAPLPATTALVEGRDYQIIKAKRLPYQEGITYLPGGNSLIYHTEQYKNQAQEIVRIDCAN